MSATIRAADAVIAANWDATLCRDTSKAVCFHVNDCGSSPRGDKCVAVSQSFTVALAV